MNGKLTAYANLRNLTLLVSLVMFTWLIYYFYTGAGGPRYLATHIVPIALAIHILFRYQEGPLYPRLPTIVNHLAVVVYLGICAYAFYYFYLHYEQIAIWRQGSYTRTTSSSAC
jgi:TRAP-type uncharacterized transport system fused permease subunit